MKVLAIYLILVFVVKVKLTNNIGNTNHNKIDLFNYNKMQSFDITDEAIESNLKELGEKILNNKLDTVKLKEKGIELKDITDLMERYVKIKQKKNIKQDSQKIEEVSKINKYQESKIMRNENQLNLIRFKEQRKHGNTKHYEEEKLNENMEEISRMKFEISHKRAEDQEQDLDGLTKEEREIYELNTRVKMLPYNIVVNNPGILLREEKKNMRVDSRTLKKILMTANFKNDKDKVNHVVPIEECNKIWDYSLHGQNWQCMCQCGKNQSPIDIITKGKIYGEYENKLFVKHFYNNIFFDFKESQLVCLSNDKELNTCVKPLIKNTGVSIDIEDDCGVLVLPPHNNGYKCHKIEIKTPAEHKIDSKSFELELQIHYEIKDKRIMDQISRDNIIVVILFKGIDEENVPNVSNGSIVNHPFLELLELDQLPKKKGHARLLKNFLNFHLLFDEIKQPYKVNLSNSKKVNSKAKFEPRFMETSTEGKSMLQKAINDLIYNKHYPLKEFYIYNGSFSKPPCLENVKYIVVPTPLFAPMDQIIKISKVIIGTGNREGNNREIQKPEGRVITYFIDDKMLFKAIEDLDLEQTKNKVKEEVKEEDDEDLDKISKEEDIKKKTENVLIDKVINSKKGNLNKILSMGNLK